MTSNHPQFREVAEAIGRQAFRRLRLKLCFRSASNCGKLIEFVAANFLHDAAALASIGVDVTGREGFRRLNGIAERRLKHSQHAAASWLREARPAIRKAIFAAAFTWLRIQFPALNVPAAVAASRLIFKILHTRKA